MCFSINSFKRLSSSYPSFVYVHISAWSINYKHTKKINSLFTALEQDNIINFPAQASFVISEFLLCAEIKFLLKVCVLCKLEPTARKYVCKISPRQKWRSMLCDAKLNLFFQVTLVSVTEKNWLFFSFCNKTYFICNTIINEIRNRNDFLLCKSKCHC